MKKPPSHSGAMEVVQSFPKRRLTWVALGVVMFAGSVRADIALSPLFSEGAVLQRDKPAPVWGTGDIGERVLVSYRNQHRTAATGPDGRWVVVFDPLLSSTEGSELVASSPKNTVVAKDVVVGDVWLCSGQSNMEFVVSRAMQAEQEIASAHFPLVRQILVERTTGDAPSLTLPAAGWKAASPATVGNFTAVGYFFARDVHSRTGIPIGLISCARGGTPIETWMSSMAIANEPTAAGVLERWAQDVAAFPQQKAEFDQRMKAWRAEEAAVKAKGEKAHAAWLEDSKRPQPPRAQPRSRFQPMGGFNGMLYPLLPCAVQGVLWYQGEENNMSPENYHALFSALITSWRAHLGQGDIPFYWVNLAGFKGYDAAGINFARIREAQTKTLALPNTAQALAIDVGDPKDIHPTNKQEVGRRLALIAKKRVYGIMADDTGPSFASVTREGGALRVRFQDADSGLIAYDRPPQALEIAGADRVFRPAGGKIEGNTLVVSAKDVPEPVAVRYAYRNAPPANLYGGNGLPVVPFRSDDW